MISSGNTTYHSGQWATLTCPHRGTEDTEVQLLINFAYSKLSQCALERQSPPRKFQHGGHLFSEKNTAKSVSRSNRWLHVTLNFVEIFLFSSLPMETGHLDMCDSLFWPFR